ncbi:MAG: GNAT family N-acetyltransferase [Acidimicrobiales bacterium]
MTKADNEVALPVEFRVHPMDPSEAGMVRRFCLDTIVETFGYGYRADWHHDLDALGTVGDLYSTTNGGGFLVVRCGDELVACGGLRPLCTHRGLSERFALRYPDPAAVGSIWRVYVRADQRGNGLGRHLTAELERLSRELGQQDVYLHTSTNRPATVAFWVNRGYDAFAHDTLCEDATVHMDKRLSRER